MANQLDELNPEVREEGLDTNVIVKKIPAKVGAGSKFFEIMLWVCGIVPGIIFLFMKINAQKYFDQLQQKIQRNHSADNPFIQQFRLIGRNEIQSEPPLFRLPEQRIHIKKRIDAEFPVCRRNQNGHISGMRRKNTPFPGLPDDCCTDRSGD